MKVLIFLGLFTSFAWAKPLVLISYFDAFNQAPFNNSERIARAIESRLGTTRSAVAIKLCPLNTIFDKAYAQTEECLKSLREAPILVIALGESTCQLKLETMMRNKDRTHGPDNAGNNRSNTQIIPGGPSALGMRYPLPQMYCALGPQERNEVDVSNSAGSFVCNNTGYQMSYHYPEIQYGFIHVPANSCSNLEKRSEAAILMLEKMILKGVTYLLSENAAVGLPHSNNEIRLPTKKDEIKRLKKLYQNDDCLSEYFKESRPMEEKRGIFMGVMN